MPLHLTVMNHHQLFYSNQNLPATWINSLPRFCCWSHHFCQCRRLKPLLHSVVFAEAYGIHCAVVRISGSSCVIGEDGSSIGSGRTNTIILTWLFPISMQDTIIFPPARIVLLPRAESGYRLVISYVEDVLIVRLSVSNSSLHICRSVSIGYINRYIFKQILFTLSI